jgi:hypothetical protein
MKMDGFDERYTDHVRNGQVAFWAQSSHDAFATIGGDHTHRQRGTITLLDEPATTVVMPIYRS